jgi:hypothetical protein
MIKPLLLLFLVSNAALSNEYGKCKETQKVRKKAVKELGIYAEKFIAQKGTLAEFAGEHNKNLYKGASVELSSYHIFAEPESGRIYSWCHLKNTNPKKYSEVVESCSYEISSGEVSCKTLRYEFSKEKK